MSLLPTDRTPLLQNGNGAHRPNSWAGRIATAIKAEGEPSWPASCKYFVFGSYINVLLVFLPLAGVAHYLNWDAGIRFAFSFISIMPLAALLGRATDELSIPLGGTWSGLLNATFGNAVEIIVGIAALLNDEIRIVQTSLLGSILSNLLLVFGCSFIAGTHVGPELNLNAGAGQMSSLMTLSCITLVIPAAYHSAKSHAGSIGGESKSYPDVVDGTDLDEVYGNGLNVLSRGASILLLLVYVTFLVFQLKTHKHLFKESDQSTQNSQHSNQSSNEPVDQEEQVAHMNTISAGLGLLIVTLVTSFCADWLVASIEETSERYHIPKPFIGLILLPIVSNAAEHVTAVWMSLKGKIDMAVTICVGSSIQIAAFALPLLVIVGWITHHNLTLFFADFETIVLFVSVILVNSLVQDGKTNYMEGIMLITLYLIIALAFWVS
ncbi:calcium/proton exchanger [Panus rudis PR-1116 ss-1]|nr:calcium/proton exchanger [Panus rudis PR-1116 ss-1]